MDSSPSIHWNVITSKYPLRLDTLQARASCKRGVLTLGLFICAQGRIVWWMIVQ